MVGGESAALGLVFLGLAPLVGLAVGGVEKSIGCLEGIMCGGLPISLSNIRFYVPSWMCAL